MTRKKQKPCTNHEHEWGIGVEYCLLCNAFVFDVLDLILEENQMLRDVVISKVLAVAVRDDRPELSDKEIKALCLARGWRR